MFLIREGCFKEDLGIDFRRERKKEKRRFNRENFRIRRDGRFRGRF